MNFNQTFWRKALPKPSSWRFMLRHPAHLVAQGFGSGLSPVVPGTVGTLWAWLIFITLPPMNPVAIMVFLFLSFLIGWWACTRTATALQVPDPSSVVWDEILAFWCVLYALPSLSVWEQGVAFVLFRLFDIFKPGPIGWLDKQFKTTGIWGGLGILLDDLAAALATCLMIALGRLVFV